MTADRREAAGYLKSEHVLSERQACFLLALARSVFRYRPIGRDDREIKEALAGLAEKHPEMGFGKYFAILRRMGKQWNHKRVHRVYCGMGLTKRRKHKRRLPTSGVATSALLALVRLDRGNSVRVKEYANAERDELWKDWAIAMIEHREGNTSASDSALERLKAQATVGDAFQIAEVHTSRREADEDFEWLERASEARDPGVTHAKVEPRFAGLAGDGRWLPLLERIGLGG